VENHNESEHVRKFLHQTIGIQGLRNSNFAIKKVRIDVWHAWSYSLREWSIQALFMSWECSKESKSVPLFFQNKGKEHRKSVKQSQMRERMDQEKQPRK
jgi:hypothetical protein